MKKILILIVFLYSLNSFSQSTVLLRGDTIKVYKQGGDAVLKVEGHLMLKDFRQGNSNDSVLTWDATTKKVRMMDRNSFAGGSTPTLQQVTTAGNTSTNALLTDNDVGFDVVSSIGGGSVRAEIGKFSDNGFLTLGNTATYTGTIKADNISGFHNYQLRETGNANDTLATLSDVRAGGGGSGTVTSVSAGFGTNFTTITSTGSVIVDTTSIGVTSWVRTKKVIDSLGALIGGSGTVNTGASGKATYYPGAGTTVDDFAAVDYAASGTNVKITTQNTTDVGLEIKGISSQAANLLNISSSSGTGDLAIITAAGASRFTSEIIGTASARKIELFANGEALFTSDATASIYDPDAFDNTTQIYGGGNARLLVSSGSGYDHSLVAVTGNLFGVYTGFIDGGGIGMETNNALNFITNKLVRATIAASGEATFSKTVTASQGSSTYKLGGSITVNTTDVGNVGAGEDDLMTYSVPAGLLAANGDYIEFTMSFDLAANANTKQVKVKFGATTIYASGAQAQNDGVITITGQIIRTGAATQRITYSVTSNATLFPDYADYVTAGETLSGAITLKATGEATSNDDIIQKINLVKFLPNN